MTNAPRDYWSKKFWSGTKVFFFSYHAGEWRRIYDSSHRQFLQDIEVLRGTVCRPPDHKLFPKTTLDAPYPEGIALVREPRVMIRDRRGYRSERRESEVFRTRAEAERALMILVMEP
jgi:hypothetical protein